MPIEPSDELGRGPGCVSGSCGFSENLVMRFHSVDGHHAERGRLLARHFDDADRDVRALLDVLGEHRAVVHLVDVIAGQHQHVLADGAAG